MERPLSFERHLDRPKPDMQDAGSGLRPVSGLALGSEILSRHGYRAVEELRVGDDVITRDRGLCRIREITTQPLRSRLVRFGRDALGEDMPDQDLLLPARQAVLVRDWRAQALFQRHEARVAAANLIDGQFITDAGMVEQDWVQIWLDAPSVLYLRGLEVLSAHGFDDQLQPAI